MTHVGDDIYMQLVCSSLANMSTPNSLCTKVTEERGLLFRKEMVPPRMATIRVKKRMHAIGDDVGDVNHY
jgi:hypothetical protein